MNIIQSPSNTGMMSLMTRIIMVTIIIASNINNTVKNINININSINNHNIMQQSSTGSATLTLSTPLPPHHP